MRARMHLIWAVNAPVTPGKGATLIQRAVAIACCVLSEEGASDCKEPAFALKFVARDMGNGVTRLETASLVAFQDAQTEAALPDRMKVPYPGPTAIADMAEEALHALGVDTSRCGCHVRKTYVRAIDDHAYEAIVWRQG